MKEKIKEILEQLVDVMEETSNEVLEYINSETPVEEGNLRDANKVKFESSDEKRIVYSIVNDLEYASYVHDGTVNFAGTRFMTNGIRRASRDQDSRISRKIKGLG